MKTAVITGASSGIGRRAVERLLLDGWYVWSLDIAAGNPSSLEACGRNGDTHREIHCDVSDPSSVDAAFSAIESVTPKIDALICSAGVVRIGSLAAQTPREIDLMLGVNVKGAWLTVRAATPLLKLNSRVDNPSRVVLLGSIAGIRPKVGSGFYSATKAAVHVLTGIFAMELAPSGVLVNSVAPGTVATPMAESVAISVPGSAFKSSGVSPLGRIGTPDDIVDVIFFLLSDAAKYVNGTVLPVDGGTRAAFVKV